MKKTAVVLVILFLAFSVLAVFLAFGFMVLGIYDHDHITTFRPREPHFSSGGPLSPEWIAANIESGKWTIGIYDYGVECRCGFVMYRSRATRSIRLRNLREPSADVRATEQEKEKPPHLGFPYPELPPWARERRSAEMGRPTLFVLYEGERVVFVGLLRDHAEDPGLADSGDISLMDNDPRTRKYISDQFKLLAYYRYARLPFASLAP